MNKINKIFKNLKKFLNEKEVNSKQIKIFISTYYMYREGFNQNPIELYFICDVKTFKRGTRNKLYVEITTTKPGVLIGEYGKNIDDLTNYLNRFIDKFNVKKIIVTIKEKNIFI